MALPPLLRLPREKDYRSHFVVQYCKGPVLTFDSIAVKFFPRVFNHAFYRDSSPTAHDKADFDHDRAQRMDWIKAVLTDATVELYRRVMPSSKVRRIALEPTVRYAVIIQLDNRNPLRAHFTTAYIVDSSSALTKMRSNPRW